MLPVAVAAPPREAWNALRDPARVEQWFGVLTGPLEPGAHVRLDFEDGDFFDLEVEHVAEPVLRFAWRFMGCGPRDSISLDVTPDGPGGSLVTVSDRQPDRSAGEALELTKGWRDFLSRLQRYLATGERSRYDWRSDVDVWAELALGADAARRLVIGSAAEWMPFEGDAANLMEADALVVDDGEEPARFAVSGVRGTGPASVRFDVRPEGVDGSLDTQIGILGRGDHSALAVSQTGFRDLPADAATQRRVRERFAAAWVAAASRAVELAERERVPS